ncbi:hypothetical protein [Yersinia ruckeri]|uniref:hypothetical protein n=1 Tax=Yersinia ruckeri TaxID=29486 RepID=UPI002237EAA2|nr:hypothetical protein [Yersinia ruckeri]MCW6598685.1 hypothetical protein [Yersinia ruckeri]
MVSRIVGTSKSLVRQEEFSDFMGYIQRERISKADFAGKTLESIVANDKLNPSAEKNVYFRLARPGTLKATIYWSMAGQAHYMSVNELDFTEPNICHTIRVDNYWDNIRIECISASEDVLSVQISS